MACSNGVFVGGGGGEEEGDGEIEICPSSFQISSRGRELDLVKVGPLCEGPEHIQAVKAQLTSSQFIPGSR